MKTERLDRVEEAFNLGYEEGEKDGFHKGVHVGILFACALILFILFLVRVL